MNPLADSIQLLAARLPELEWKLASIAVNLQPKLLPRSLFRAKHDLTPQIFIEEIKTDLNQLHIQTNEKAKHYLTERISRKINVLVQICKTNTKLHTPSRHPGFGTPKLSTRQQWLADLEKEMTNLKSQAQALTQRIAILPKHNVPELKLNLQAELGIIEKQLTLTEEIWQRATQW